VTRRITPTAVMIALLAGCGPWQREGAAPPRPSEGNAVPQLLEPRSLYQKMGFIVGSPPLSFVASVRFLAAATPDSTLAVVCMSLANHTLSFRRTVDEFVAGYHVEVSFRRDTQEVRRLTRDEVVRVRTFQETLRADESIIFQQFITLPPGVFNVQVVVRDRNGPASAAQERVDTVPDLHGRALGEPVAVYEGAGRTALTVAPKFVANPRATLPYGADSIRFYVEGYGMPAGTKIVARVVDGDGAELLRDTIALSGSDTLASAQLVLAGATLPIGSARLFLDAPGTAAHASTPFLVSLSDQWAIANFDEMANLLRYFGHEEMLAKLRAAPRDQRAALWRKFYKDTDPVPLTPENEALDEYFQRLGIANTRYEESGQPGWLTDRGEVFITLGDPDEVYEVGGSVSPSGARALQWEYTNLRLTVLFQDAGGFGVYRMTPESRAEYLRVLAQVRREQQ